MTKKEYIEMTGEDPEDMFGPDWQNIIDEMQIYEQTDEEKN